MFLSIALRKMLKILSKDNLINGLKDVFKTIDEHAEEIPNAPIRLGQVIGQLYNHFDNLQFLYDEEDNINTFSKITASLIGTLESSDSNFDFEKAGLSKHFVSYRLDSLKKKLSPRSIDECCRLVEETIKEDLRANPAFARLVLANLKRQFKRSWLGDDISEEDLKEEKAVFEKYIPLLVLFSTSEEAKNEIHAWIDKQGSQKDRAREHLHSCLEA